MDLYGIASWLSRYGDISGVYRDNLPDRWVGAYDPNNKSIQLSSSASPEALERTMSHELVHALQHSSRPDRTFAIANMLHMLGQTDEGKGLIDQMAFPTHWAQGRVENENINVASTHPMYSMLQNTASERMDKAGKRAAMSTALVPSGGDQVMQTEKQAYYLTEPGLGVPDQYKQLGLYLRNYGVPWEYLQNSLRLYANPAIAAKRKGD